MRNSIKKSVAILLVFVAFSFTIIDGDKKDVKVDDSKITWKGYKVTGEHEGLISIKSGSLSFEEDKLTAGEFVIDMNTITCTDLKGMIAKKLVKHLKSDDFFEVEKYSTASLVFTELKSVAVNTYEVIGDITIKGKTEKVAFNITIEGNKAKAILKIDRTKFDIKYRSGSFFDNLKNKAINNEFDLVVDLVF